MEEEKEIKYRYPEKRATAILKILHEQTDEKHTLKQSEINDILEKKEMKVHRDTLSKVIYQLADALNPSTYNVKSDGTNNEDEFIIKFDGYDNERATDSYVYIKKKNRKTRDEIKQGKREGEESPGTSPSMTNIHLQHPFSYKELDQLMDAINFSDKLTLEEKRNLMEKVSKTSSRYYETPFYNKDTKELQYNYNTTNKRFGEDTNLIENLKNIQKAINDLKKIRFTYNHYNENNVLEANSTLEVSPYYVVVDNDLYYLISGVKNQKNPMHSRIDLMTNIEILDEKIDSIRNFPDIPTREKWEPTKYLGEHIYMGYNKPVEIKIKQKKECGYNRYHDWFGDHYTVSDENCEDGYEIIIVKNSPYMMAFWALQYGEQVEILNEDVRERVREILKNLNEKYKE